MEETKKEPTTQELFVAVHEDLTGIEQQTHELGLWKLSERTRDTLAAIALLKRRMGAMENVMRKARETLFNADPVLADEIEAALTDAPPVFTLEEVEREHKVALDDTIYLLERLAALRSARGGR